MPGEKHAADQKFLPVESLKENAMKNKQSLLLILVTLLIVSLACSVVGGSSSEPETPADAPAEEPVPTEEVEEAPAAEAESEEETDVDAEAEAEEAEADETESEMGDAEESSAEEPAQEEADSSEESEEAPAEAAESQEYDTEFPLPEDVQNFMLIGDQVNFATSLTVEEAIEFYRGALGDMGLTERTLNTAITETTFSMVFDGHENGKAVVVQGVDLGNGTTNINIRFEDV